MLSWKNAVWATIAATVLAIGAAWFLGSRIVAPAPQFIASPPSWFPAEEVVFKSASGSQIHGWYRSQSEAKGSVVLLHPVRGNRQSMLGRARFLSRAGYAVLLIDFQAHGESLGNGITFGYLESLDAIAAVRYAKNRNPELPTFVVGSSLGGAAALIAEPPLDVDGMILEMVFPTIEIAIKNRLRIRLGSFGELISPLLAAQIEPRLGVELAELSPLTKAPSVVAPVLIISGNEDKRTTASDTSALFGAFQSSKTLWLIDGARHQDLHAFTTEEYERRVLFFINRAIENAT